MNYSLLRADCRTHIEIVALALFSCVLLGFAAHGSGTASGDIAATISAPAVAKPHLTGPQSFAQFDGGSACRINAL